MVCVGEVIELVFDGFKCIGSGLKFVVCVCGNWVWWNFDWGIMGDDFWFKVRCCWCWCCGDGWVCCIWWGYIMVSDFDEYVGEVFKGVFGCELC